MFDVFYTKSWYFGAVEVSVTLDLGRWGLGPDILYRPGSLITKRWVEFAWAMGPFHIGLGYVEGR